MPGKWVAFDGARLDRVFVDIRHRIWWWWPLRPSHLRGFPGEFGPTHGAATYENGCFPLQMHNPFLDGGHTEAYYRCDCPCHWEE